MVNYVFAACSFIDFYYVKILRCAMIFLRTSTPKNIHHQERCFFFFVIVIAVLIILYDNTIVFPMCIVLTHYINYLKYLYRLIYIWRTHRIWTRCYCFVMRTRWTFSLVIILLFGTWRRLRNIFSGKSAKSIWRTNFLHLTVVEHSVEPE